MRMQKLTEQQSQEFIRSRRSVFPKEFEPGSITKEEVTKLLEVARWAPTHKLTQPWRFSVIMGDAKETLIDLQLKALFAQVDQDDVARTKATKFRFNAERSAAIVAVVMRRDELARVPRYEEEWAVACAVQNIHLHARSKDIGMYWSTGASTNSPDIRKWLNVSKDDVHMGWLYLGRFAQTKERAKERMDVMDFISWK